ncbi:MAG: hypothetical protein J7M26_01325 [Armatimonadetes bacterium]|nr:hypothetical protein [Armatimonadota bacterium]
MGKLVMRRSAADNVYLHKDFHGALSAGLQYLEDHYGPEAVREYLRDFTLAYFAPLRERLAQEGLSALKTHFEEMYALEGGEVSVRLAEDGSELTITVHSCPAIKHMREHNYAIADSFFETTRTVNEALCEGTEFAAELVECQCGEGRCVQRFFRRPTQ